MERFNPSESYFRVATACPEVFVADVARNTAEIKNSYEKSTEAGAALLVFPELSITGYSIGDLVQQTALLNQAETGLAELAEATNDTTAMIVGLPLRVGNGLYNCAAVLAEGQVKGIVPKQNMPTYGEFYEKRWYQNWDQPNTTIKVGNNDIPFGNDLLFDIGGVRTGIEICEDLWVLNAPNINLTNNGAEIIANPSASPELVGKAAYRRALVSMTSAKTMGGYAYAGCDWTESTQDIVMGGHQIIGENGRIVNERRPFYPDSEKLIAADIDIDHIRHDRIKDTNFVNKLGAHIVQTTVERPDITPKPRLNAHPFLPGGESVEDRAERLQSIIDIQAHGLARRIKQKNLRKLHLGLSGGLDSTLAFVVGVRAAEILGQEPKDVLRTYTMPGEASSERTQNNAVKLANLYDIPNDLIPIGDMTDKMLEALKHTGEQDITYENTQARTRESILLNKANQLGGIVLGTGDLSEIALGWCTFNADHISHYHVNAGVPKTLVRHLVTHVADSGDNPDIAQILRDIVDTPISPELVSDRPGELSQKTEDQIGPYELHDFFLYQFIRYGDERAKVEFLAKQAFAEKYKGEEIAMWLEVFTRRFFANQFKRSVMPDGAKVGSVALSPRGDWRMPSDLYNAAVWQA